MDKTELLKIEKQILLDKEDPKGIFLIKEFRKANKAVRAYIASRLKVDAEQLQNELIKEFIIENREKSKELRSFLKNRKITLIEKQEYLESKLNNGLEID